MISEEEWKKIDSEIVEKYGRKDAGFEAWCLDWIRRKKVHMCQNWTDRRRCESAHCEFQEISENGLIFR